jgi:hypothetical protein
MRRRTLLDVISLEILGLFLDPLQTRVAANEAAVELYCPDRFRLHPFSEEQRSSLDLPIEQARS